MAYQGAPLPEWLQDFYNRKNIPEPEVSNAVAPVAYRAPQRYPLRRLVDAGDSGDGYTPAPTSQATPTDSGIPTTTSPVTSSVPSSGLWSGAMSILDTAQEDLNTFLDNPVDTVGGYLGFDMNSKDTSTPFSNVGEAAKNIGAGAGLSGFVTGPAGMAVEGVAGLFETSALNDTLRSMNAEPLGVFDVAFAALSPTSTLRDEAMESFDKGIMSGDIYDSPWSRAAAVGSDRWNQMDESFDRQNNFNKSMDSWEAQNAPTQDTINPIGPSFNSMIRNALDTPVAPNPAPVTSAPLAPVAPSQSNSGGGGGYSSGDFDDGNSGAGDTGGGYSDESGYDGESQDSDW